MRTIDKPHWMDGYTEAETWFDTHVQPVNDMLEAGLEVYELGDSYTDEGNWYEHPDKNKVTLKHRALLINIQPIKKETAEDVLRDYFEMYKHVEEDLPGTPCCDLLNRAKAVLEGKGE